MTIGNGIAIAGIWMFPVACAFAPKITPIGFLMSVIIASVFTSLFQ